MNLFFERTKTILPAIALSMLSLFTLADAAGAQTPYHIAKGSSITITGTSTLHDWTVHANEFTGNAAFVFLPDSSLKQVANLSITVPVKNLKSTEGAMMDKNMYKTLKTEQISFALSSVTQMQSSGSRYDISGSGILEIGGMKKKMAFKVLCSAQVLSSLSCTGSLRLKMTDFGLVPPTFFMGTLKTGDDVTINYELHFQP